MNGIGITSKNWVEALERATLCTNLGLLTLLPFEGILSCQAVFRRTRAWCPACYEDWRSAGEDIYEPLLWAIVPVTVCPQHRRPLEEACPHCHGRLMPLAVSSRPGYCSRCQAWLGNDKADSAHEHPARLPAEIDVPLWQANAIGGLLAHAPRLKGSSLRNAFVANFRACVDAVAEGNRLAFARATRVAQCTVNYQMAGKSLPRISTLLRICRHLNIPMTVLLESDSAHLAADLAQAKDAVRKYRQLPLSRTPAQVRLVLENALREQPAPSLSELACRLGYKGVERLYQVDRNLSKQISANYRKSGRSHWWRKPGAVRICALSDIQKLLEQSLAQERPVSAHHIAASLGYAGDGYLQLKFPDICRAIGRKIAAHDEPRITIMESALEDALRENQVPTLSDLCRRLGYSNSVVLRYHFPDLCDEILARRRELRNQQIAQLRKTLQAVSLEEPAPSFLRVCKRIGLSHAALAETCPEECAAIRARYLRSRSEATRRKKQQLGEEVCQIVQRLQNDGKCPSVVRVATLLSKTALTDWRILNAAVQAARREPGSAK